MIHPYLSYGIMLLGRGFKGHMQKGHSKSKQNQEP